MTDDMSRMLEILNFWHKVEFFIPFDLDDRMRAREGRKSFWRLRGDRSAIVFTRPPKGMIVSGYTLYLGVFDKGDVRDVVHRAVPQDEAEQIEEQQRADVEGRTCIASLRLDQAARPLFDSIEVSTLPWAVGRVREGGLAALTSEAFAAARQGLVDRIRNFAMARSAEAPPGGDGLPLQPAELGALVALFCDWAAFQPDRAYPEAAIEVMFKNEPRRPEARLPPDDEEEGEDEEAKDDEYEIGILNSFYIEDLEQAMADAAAGRMPEALRRYLTPLAAAERLDLYTEPGRRRIVEALAPTRMNRGRWPGNPAHSMSLMQQFAINTAREHLVENGLASVNGPPGTGKTTLLRDIIADNIVTRARVLAGLNQAQDAFDGKITIANGFNPMTLSRLIPALTGFEMVVASSNNAAVDNISRDLPKRDAVGGDKAFGYLQRVAHKVAAQKDSGPCRKLPDDDMPWGLVACALGRKANRRAFGRRLLGLPIKPDARKSWAGEERPLNLWQWRDEVEVPPFAEAARAFQAADASVEAMVTALAEFAALQQRLRGHTAASWCSAAERACAEARAKEEAAQQAAQRNGAELEAARADLAGLREEERLLDRKAPAWWQALFGTGAARAHRLQVQVNAEEQIRLRRQEAELGRAASAAAAMQQQAAVEAEAAARRLEAAAEAWSRLTEIRLGFIDRFGAIAPPDALDALEGDDVRKAGLWHRPELAQARSALFQAALRLQEAWLAEVSARGGGFGSNLVACSRMLQDGPEGDAAARQVVWQSLFMVVPVISTTFASCARQFRGLEAASLGWLFIDEAGQAVPQAAVGALYRAQRAMVIGDPLQIEPVFTLPKRLIADLAALSRHTRDGSYSPDAVSVQVLADAANRLGTEIPGEGDGRIWIGSPLRVHRRCHDPMFGLSNAIAYQGKMVFGLGQRLPPGDAAPFYGESAWIDLPGRVEGRQAVPEQIEFVARLLGASHAAFGRLPDLYVITPFKEIKEQLIRSADRFADIWEGTETPSESALDTWLKARIGTVHTFQGKEEDIVVMVLGTDAQTQGAAYWAAAKPNLLNVALTRAKRRFYMVGERDLWMGQPFFSQAARALPRTTPEAFMNQARAAWLKRLAGG